MAVAARNGMYCAKVPGRRPLHAADHRRVATFITCRSCPSPMTRNKMEPTLQRLSARNTRFQSVQGGTEASAESRSNGHAGPSSFIWQMCPLIDIKIPQKGNARHDVKGNLPIGPLNDVLVFRNRPSWAK